MSGSTAPSGLALHSEGGAPLHVGLRAARVTPAAVLLDIDLDAAAYARAMSECWFHLGPITAGAASSDVPAGADVGIELQLDPRLAAGVAAALPTGDALGAALLDAGPVDALVSGAAWFARSVTWQVDDPAIAEIGGDGATLREGYRTMWGSGRRVAGALPLAAVVAGHLERRGWSATPLEVEPGFRWRLATAEAEWETWASVDDDAGTVWLRSVVDLDVDPEVDLNTGADIARHGGGRWELVDVPPRPSLRAHIDLADVLDARTAVARAIDRHLDAVDATITDLLRGG